MNTVASTCGFVGLWEKVGNNSFSGEESRLLSGKGQVSPEKVLPKLRLEETVVNVW